jgi:hypothetical protein
MSKKGENEDDKWITVTGSGKTKKLLSPKLKPTLHNAFAILSQPNDLTNYNMSGPPLQMDDNKTSILHDPQEHRRQCKIARQQHIKQTLRRLHDSNDLFLNNSITLAEDKQTSLAKAVDSNKKRMAINTAHTKRGTKSIGFAQCGHNAAYSLGSAFNPVFTKEEVSVFKEEDVLITCKGKPILIGVRDSQGHYQIPLMQQLGQWQPRCPSKQARKALRQANSVYDLPLTKQAIKWMHC